MMLFKTKAYLGFLSGISCKSPLTAAGTLSGLRRAASIGCQGGTSLKCIFHHSGWLPLFPEAEHLWYQDPFRHTETRQNLDLATAWEKLLWKSMFTSCLRGFLREVRKPVAFHFAFFLTRAWCGGLHRRCVWMGKSTKDTLNTQGVIQSAMLRNESVNLGWVPSGITWYMAWGKKNVPAQEHLWKGLLISHTQITLILLAAASWCRLQPPQLFQFSHKPLWFTV